LSQPSKADTPSVSLDSDLEEPDPFRLEGGAVGGGFGLFVGLPLVATGIVLLAGSWRYVSFYLDGPSGELAKYLLGWILAALGALAALGGEVWYLDSRSRTFVRTWRFLRWPLRSRSVEFTAIEAVRCVRLVVGNGAHEAFAVEIALPNDKKCRLASRAHLHEALAMSARLCQLLDLPLGAARTKPG
jgi:hypothetical protein